MYRIISASFILFALAVQPLQAQEAQQAPQPKCYQVGETIDPGVTVVSEYGQEIKLLDLVDPDTRLIYLLLYGGPTLLADKSDGVLWCGDSFNDMPISNFMFLKYQSRGVKFVPVACPPVYHEDEYGIPEGTFLKAETEAEVYQNTFQQFIDETLDLRDMRIIPFTELYFDPRFQLLFNFEKMKDRSAYRGKNVPWLGKFKPCSDDQTYSTPTIWLLSPEGKVLHAPFVGNRYTSGTQRIAFTISDVDSAIAKLLARK